MALLALGLLAIGLVGFGSGPGLARKPHATTQIPAANKPQVVETFGKLPLYFIENQGQLDPRVAYYIQGGDKSIYFTGRGVTFALTAALTGAGDGKTSSEALVHPASYRGTGGAKEHGPQREAERWVVKLDFVDADPSARPVGQEPTAALISYFKGPREEWTTGLPTYASLIYRDLWPGIDLVYTGTGSRLKYSFLVQPGADPNQIQLAYRGATAVRINEAGQLEVSTPLESFQEDKPYAYQEAEGQRREVAAVYSLEGEISGGVQFGFQVGAYDPHKVLVIDPVVLLYAGYIGGSGTDCGGGIAVDSMGNAYIIGYTSSSEATFPVTVGPDLTHNGGDRDAFVAKVNPSGTALDYASYIGGSDFDFRWGHCRGLHGQRLRYLPDPVHRGHLSGDGATRPDLQWLLRRLRGQGEPFGHCPRLRRLHRRLWRIGRWWHSRRLRRQRLRYRSDQIQRGQLSGEGGTRPHLQCWRLPY